MAAIVVVVVVAVVVVVVVVKVMLFWWGCRWLPRASGTKKCLKSTYGHLS